MAGEERSVEEPSDAALVRQAQAGDAAAYARLVERHQERAVRLAFTLVHHWEDARDLSQEAFVKAFRRLETFRADAAFSTWFYRILVNTCRDFQRRARVRRWLSLTRPATEDEEELSVFDAPSPAPAPDAQAADQELGIALTQAIDQLPPRQRAAFILKHLEGMTIEEVAQVLQCAPGTVKAHLFHATGKLQAWLAPFRPSTGGSS